MQLLILFRKTRNNRILHVEKYRMQISQEVLNALKKKLFSSENIVIITHHNPDGDALGSSLSLADTLLSLGKNVTSIAPSAFPDFLTWMKGAEKMLIGTEQMLQCREKLSSADMIFCLDFNAPKRVQTLSDLLSNSKAYKVLIDHHLEPDTAQFDTVISDIRPSSTSEIIWNIIEQLELLNYVSVEGAECIYAGIMTDTGSFSYSAQNPETYLIVAKLVELGIDPEKIHRLVYDTFTESRMKLLGFCLNERMKVIPEHSTAYIYLTKEDLKRFNYKVGDTEGIVNYTLSIGLVKFGALFTERDDKIRISFRSKGDFNVNQFSHEHFGGGGHKNASGGDSFISMLETLNRFESILNQYDELKKQD